MDHRRYQRSGGIYHDGFLYITRSTKHNIRYLICSKYRRLGCIASGKIHLQEGNVFIPIKVEHNHPRDDNRVEAMDFRIQLREACVRERGTLKNIYERVAARNVDGAVEVPFNVIRRSMLRWSQATRPNVPATLTELADIFRTGNWPRYTDCTSGRFFSGVVEANGLTAVVFGNREFIGNFIDSQHTFIDGTFKAVPRRPNFCQILTIFATCMDHAFPVAHIFMERRTKILYDAVFAYLRENFPQFVNINVVTDYEVALVESLRNNFPNASLHGCFFHYCQAVLRKARTLGITRQIEGRPNGRVLLKKYYCLALLPAEMIEPTLVSLQVFFCYQSHFLFVTIFSIIRTIWTLALYLENSMSISGGNG
ncbi:uncharacterized protein LOC126746707 isoform X1 [Anthonomus grandis grandis]|uniref:uncharacterized protein LOC126746707 isoform X1 n=1 Tax=Anthonomus grandis grandis TaxID=2921223 RepID=UPI0021662885|nr:uncharacterized protein LOC126746707 isoform X1 [Anthonomus grandis grandis]XP_050311004.1 uncharacterized protein LOC126746707 isoform X1 [Anthonomus grandis grandis]